MTDTTGHPGQNRLTHPPTSPAVAEVHVWRVELEQPEATVRELARLLTGDELARARRFRRPELGRHFTVARAALRTVLGRCTAIPPGDIRFAYGEHGKPHLARPSLAPELHFNLSHSGPLAVIAVAAGRRVGVDVERIRRDIRALRIARRFFSEGEARVLEELPPARRCARFFALWTRKEAYIKALGRGLFQPLDVFRVPVVDHLSGGPLATGSPEPDSSAWHIVDLNPGPGFVGALVAEGCDWSPREGQLEL